MAAEPRHEAALRRRAAAALRRVVDAAEALAPLVDALDGELPALDEEARGHARTPGPVQDLRDAVMDGHVEWQAYLAVREQREAEERAEEPDG